MKRSLLIPSVAALALLCSPALHGQTVARETPATSSAAAEVTGTVAECHPDSVTILNKDVAGPIRLSFAKKVEYVDAAGKPVAREMVTPGVPVTMRFLREGDRMLVDRVIVKRPLAPTPPETATAPETAKATGNGTPPPKPVAGHAATEIEKLRGTIQQEERQLTDHPR